MKTKYFTKETMRLKIADILTSIDPNPERSGLKETPIRVAKYFEEMTSGYDVDPESVLKLFEDGAKNVDQMIFQGAIPFYSICEHHLVPFFGVAHIGYIPRHFGPFSSEIGGRQKILGLSKFSRVVDVFAKRLQVQERLTDQIAECLHKHLTPVGVGVVVRARHLCMEARGVKARGTITYTSALRGEIKDDGTARAEFMEFVKMADNRMGAI